ncbi:MAG: copper ion binding protein [Synergistaceae bacterium]|nr:copper ion binding protein [Synergistaceae bacterium]
MDSVTFNVDGMSCEHCVKAIVKAIGELPGTGDVIVDLENKKVTAAFDGGKVSAGPIRAAIEDQGYDVIG